MMNDLSLFEKIDITLDMSNDISYINDIREAFAAKTSHQRALTLKELIHYIFPTKVAPIGAEAQALFGWLKANGVKFD